MAEYELIDAYLRELRYSMDRVHNADVVAEEVSDHLIEAVEWLAREGHSPVDAQTEALARFGSAPLVSRVFVQDRKRGAAVPTIMTRRAGLAAMLAPPLVASGVWMVQNWHVGIGYAANVVCTGAGVLLTLFGLWGLRRRHGGLGTIGRIAFWLLIASPLLAAPFSWGAPAVLAAVVALDLMLVGVGMLRAPVLPRIPVVLFAGVRSGSSPSGDSASPSVVVRARPGCSGFSRSRWASCGSACSCGARAPPVRKPRLPRPRPDAK